MTLTRHCDVQDLTNALKAAKSRIRDLKSDPSSPSGLLARMASAAPSSSGGGSAPAGAPNKEFSGFFPASVPHRVIFFRYGYTSGIVMHTADEDPPEYTVSCLSSQFLLNFACIHLLCRLQEDSVGVITAPLIPELQMDPTMPPQAQEHNKNAVLLKLQAVNFQVRIIVSFHVHQCPFISLGLWS